MIWRLSTLLALFLVSYSQLFATHISGAEIVYTCTGNDEYEVSLLLYTDCEGIVNAPPSVNINFTSTCGDVFTLTYDSVGTAVEVSQLCDAVLPQSSCNGGSLPGVLQNVYTGTATLPACESWTMDWDDCCRNTLILNVANPLNQSFYVRAQMNNLDFPCNDSPSFTSLPIPYVCVNDPVNYSYGAIDAEGDSLGYTLISAMDVGAVPLPYNAGFSGMQPVPGATIDPLNGLLSFTPPMIGSYVFVVMVEQFDSQGNVIGTMMRDMQFVVISCPNNGQPSATAGGIATFSGVANQLDSNSVVMCNSGDFCFDITITDPDMQDTLTLTSNIDQVLPGATFSYTGINPVTGTVCWAGVPGNEGLNSFLIAANDGQCPTPSIQGYVYDVLVVLRTFAGADQSICGPLQTAQLDVTGGSVFNWSVLPGGDPINVGVNFTCNPCASPIADPSVTTSYVVTSDLPGGCIAADTVTVFVVPDFTFNAIVSSDTVCLGETIDFDITNVTPSGPGYIYEWVPAVGLNNPNIPNPTGIYDNPGNYNYTVNIASPDGCVHLDTSLTVTVLPGYVPIFSTSQDDEFVCEGGSTQVHVNLDCELPNSCGLYSGPCCGPLSTQDAGTGTQQGTGTSYPAIYGNWYDGAKHQIMYRASELQAIGFAGGLINEIGFEVATINGTTRYHDLEIKMGCTTLNEFNGAAWISGMTSVFFEDTVNIQQGWNTYSLPESFSWDGSSNLVIEVCFNNEPYAGITNNSPNFFTQTAYNSVIYDRADGDPDLCSSMNIFGVSQERPNTRFIFCGGVDNSNLSYQWSPAGDFADPTAQSTTVTPSSSPAVYTVTVGELGTGCSGTETVTVQWSPGPAVSFTPSPSEGVFPFTPTFLNGSDPSVTGFTWNFNGLGSSNDPNPSFTFDVPGIYYITLIGIDADGCFSTYLDSIEVLNAPFVSFPNVVSPNGDGSNDDFIFVEYRGFREFTVNIFDRWGKEVHTTTSRNNVNQAVWRPSNDVPDGTYFYVFIGTGSNFEVIEKTGHVTLVR